MWSVRPKHDRKVFTLLVELRCNSYCVFCGQREVDEALIKTRRRLGLSVPATTWGDTRGRYTLATATEALDRARGDGFSELSLQGGEPTLFPEIIALVAGARRLGFEHIGIVTNGRKLRDRVFAEALLGAGLDAVTASLLGADAETHDALSAAPGSFDALVEGLRNCADIAGTTHRSVVLNVNLITSARSVDQLADEVRLIAGLGVRTAVVHLVRFSGLASDPNVREPLRFDIRRIREPLAAAMATAASLGVTLHAADVPLCLHPRLAADELELLVRRESVSRHRFEAAAFEYDLDMEPRVSPDACHGCLLEHACPRVPPEYLLAEAPDALRPITTERVRDDLNDVLAGLEPDRAGAAARLGELEQSIDALETLAREPNAFARERATLREAFADLVLLGIRRRDAAEMMAAFHGLIGLVPPTEVYSGEDLWRRLGLASAELIARAGAVPERDAPSGLRLRFGDFRLGIEGSPRGGGVVDLTRVVPILSEARAPEQTAARAVFLTLVTDKLRRAVRLRLSAEALELDTGRGFTTAWAIARRGAIALETGPETLAAPVVRR